MDLIFSSALFTIIAATGRDATAGLFHTYDLGERIAEGLDITGIDFFQSRRDQEGWFHETRGWT
jgi:hypothetical protein